MNLTFNEGKIWVDAVYGDWQQDGYTVASIDPKTRQLTWEDEISPERKAETRKFLKQIGLPYFEEGKNSRFFKRTVEFSVHKYWVEDGFNLTQEEAQDMLERRLFGATSQEVKARILTKPTNKALKGL